MLSRVKQAVGGFAGFQTLAGVLFRVAARATERIPLRASLAARPVTLPASQSPTGTTIHLDNDGLASEVHQLLTGADTAVYVPLLIHTLATAKHKTAALATVLRQIQMAGLPLGGFLPESVISYPIRCAEPWASYQPGQIADASSYYYQYIQADAQFWQYACTLIPAPGAAARYGPPKPSNVPVLMINGTADPQDPPANMSGAQDIWPNSRLLIEPGQSHQMDYGASGPRPARQCIRPDSDTPRFTLIAPS